MLRFPHHRAARREDSAVDGGRVSFSFLVDEKGPFYVVDFRFPVLQPAREALDD